MRFKQNWKIVFLLAACYASSSCSGAPVTCDLVFAKQCTNNFVQELSDLMQSANNSREFASHICNVTYPVYQECTRDCNQTVPNIWVSAIEFFCDKTEYEQEVGLDCLCHPGVSEGIVTCNAGIPHKTADACGLLSNYTSCVAAVTSQLCTPVGSSLINDYVVHQLEYVLDDFSCYNSTTPQPFTTPGPVPEPNLVCGSECLQYISSPSLAYNEALVRENFSLQIFLESCSDLDLYNQCMTKYTDCDADNEALHFTLRDPIAYACGPAKSGITVNRYCWEKKEVKEMWTRCIYGVLAQDNDICTTWIGRLSCLNKEISKHCYQGAVSVVHGFTDAIANNLFKSLNCSGSISPTAEPEMTDTPCTPEPEPEMTVAPVTSEPEPEMTDVPVTSEPEPEMTDVPVTSEPEPQSTSEPEPRPEVTDLPTPTPFSPEQPSPTQCDMAAYSQCVVSFNQKIQIWIQSVVTNSVLTNNFNISSVDTLCSTFLDEYKPCVDPTISGCTRDVTLLHDTLTAALEYVCTADRSALLGLVQCVGEGNVRQGLMQCSTNIPQTTTAVCDFGRRYSDCVNDVTSGLCSKSDVVTLNKLLSHSLQPYNEYFACSQSSTPQTTTSTTTTPSTTTTTATSTTTFKTITDTVTGFPGLCTQDCRRELDRVFAQGNITLQLYTEACPLYADFKQCYDNKPDNCKRPGPDDIIIEIFNYTCGDGYQPILDNADCWRKPEVNSALINCSYDLYSGSPDQMCRAYASFDQCIQNSIQNACNTEAAEVMMNFIAATTRSARLMSQCPDPVFVTPTPSRNIACYDCHSGGTSWRNPHCTVDGNVTDGMVGVTSCSESCFAKTSKWNKQVIFRGCADFFLPQDYPRPLPRSGCREISGETWCFCSSDKCNTMPVRSNLP